ncbi:class I SAM-dependent methyltransferase [Candidatus Saccharibacteria bacterium]|nr:class I SAM-dependent methyltransferase [Candidatus Saccharibacteria bacterium]
MTWRNDQVSQPETEKIIEVARECLVRPGDFVELGCYKGDTALLVAEILPSDRRLYIYDSFEGLPEKSAKDVSVLGEDFRGGELAVTKREVKERFLRAGLKVPVIKKAWFNELTPEDMPEKIAFAFLDGDFYESIKDSLKLVGPRMVDGGVIIVHDYNNPALPGVKKAVDEWACGKDVEKSEHLSMVILRNRR